MVAVQNGHVEVVDTLLQHGASVDSQNNVSAGVVTPRHAVCDICLISGEN